MRIVLKKRFSDGTLAVDMDPLSLLMRLCAAVPAPRFHTVRYAGVLAAASKWRPRIVPRIAAAEDDADSDDKPKRKGSRYWPWAQLMGIRCTRSVLHVTDGRPHSLTHAATRQSSNVGRANS